jgi:hypothetical protein
VDGGEGVSDRRVEALIRRPEPASPDLGQGQVARIGSGREVETAGQVKGPPRKLRRVHQGPARIRLSEEAAGPRPVRSVAGPVRPPAFPDSSRPSSRLSGTTRPASGIPPLPQAADVLGRVDLQFLPRRARSRSTPSIHRRRSPSAAWAMTRERSPGGRIAQDAREDEGDPTVSLIYIPYADEISEPIIRPPRMLVQGALP